MPLRKWLPKPLRGITAQRSESVPRLIVAQKVLDHIREVASQFLEDETGESLIGLSLPPSEQAPQGTIVVLDTIAPDETVVRQSHMFEQGDTLQEDIFLWLSENWNAYREQRRAEEGRRFTWDAPLKHLGDWHKQPGYMITPSGGDLRTAQQILNDRKARLDFLLVPIVTIGHPPTIDSSNLAPVNYTLLADGNSGHTRIDWWYIPHGGRRFQPIAPLIYADKDLPTLMPYPWNLTDYARLNAEMQQLQRDGFYANVLELNVDDELPLKICLLCAREGAESMYILVTRWDFPKTAPEFYVAPFMRMDSGQEMYDYFWQLWEDAKRLEPPHGWRWRADKRLLDFIHVMEEAHELLPKPEPEPQPADEAPAPEAHEDAPDSAPAPAPAADAPERDPAPSPAMDEAQAEAEDVSPAAEREDVQEEES